ncbi:hypothetical protein AWH62_11835 [Maricaulis sp. W15]|uniref:hypothetical protein n=1 Tax=Maricaulis sp. W15 TaxID=1772333 RepID=UPI0009491713|nr:hypothetical protein [Maricaulis sp. W15]OLF71819.1 hypothetical protein AWH62_11835 [Maricaulis sp. W15]
MALLVPIVLVAILLFLALRYRSRDGGLRACLWRLEQSLVGALENGTVAAALPADPAALQEAPEHLYRLLVDALTRDDRETRLRAIAAIREYRDFRGWKV